MEKRTRKCIISACVSITLGIVLVTLSAVSGGIDGAKQMMENNQLNFAQVDLGKGNTATKHTISISQTDAPNLTLNLGAGEFEIVEGEGTEVVIQSNRDIHVSGDDKDIAIKTANQEFWNVIGDNHYEVSIQVPKGTKFESVTMDVGAGEMICTSLTCEDLVMEIGAGRIQVEEITCKEGAISVGAGEIIAKNATSGDLDIDVGMGNFTYSGQIKGNLEADCDMGNIQMELAGAEEDYNYQIDCDMGNVTVGSITCAGVSAEKDIDNGAEMNFDLECGMGNLEICFSEE